MHVTYTYIVCMHVTYTYIVCMYLRILILNVCMLHISDRTEKLLEQINLVYLPLKGGHSFGLQSRFPSIGCMYTVPHITCNM